MKKVVKKQSNKSSILIKALSGNLEKMSKSSWVRSIKDGKNFVCPYCELPVKPCKSRSSSMCEHMLLEGTVGKYIEDALKDPVRTNYGKCVVCGRRLSTSHLKKNPTAEVCSQCIRKSKKVRAKQFART